MAGCRGRVRSGEAVVGTCVKTRSPQTIEVLARTALDCAVLDAEHAPFGIESLALALGAAHRAALPTLVRVPDHNAAFINACLPMGADGIVVPHVRQSADVDPVADAGKSARGSPGSSPSSRAGDHGPLRACAGRTTTVRPPRGEKEWQSG